MAKSANDILREYLVAVRFDVDKNQQKKMDGLLKDLDKKIVRIGEVAAGTATVLAASVVKIAASLEKLYYSSQRTGASAGNIQSLRFAAEQVGVSADEAQGALEGFAKTLRNNPGLMGYLRTLGINPNQDRVKVFTDLLDSLSKRPYYQAVQIASLFGIDEQTYFMLSKNREELEKYIKTYQDLNKGTDAAAQRSHQFMQKLNDLKNRFLELTQVIGDRLLPLGEDVIEFFDSIIKDLVEADKATNGWSSHLVAVASALASVIGGMKILQGIGGVFGIGGGAGGAAAGAAKAGGTGAAGVVGAGVLGGLLAKWGIDIHSDTLDIKSNSENDSVANSNRNELAWGRLYTKETGKSPLDVPLEYAAWLREKKNSHDSFSARHSGAPTKGADSAPLNNPGNLRLWGNNPLVERFRNGVSIGNFAQFGSSNEGLQAMAKQLMLYSGRGKNTLNSILSTYAPSKENDVEAYVKDASGRMGVGGDQQLNLKDPGVLASLMQAMIHHEQGRDPFNMQMISDAAKYSLGGDGGRSVVLSQKTEITVNGSGDASAVGKTVVENQKRVNGDLVRNLSGAVE